MDRHTHSAQVERLEVVETGRRRRWSETIPSTPLVRSTRRSSPHRRISPYRIQNSSLRKWPTIPPTHTEVRSIGDTDRRKAETLSLTFDRDANDTAPFGPRAVIATHIRIIEHLCHHEVSEGRSVAEFTIRNDVLVGRRTALLQHAADFLGRLERTVLPEKVFEMQVLGTWNVAKPFSPVVWSTWRT